MSKIKIACKGADVLPLSAFEEFQGNLKSLSEASFKKLKREILERGFSFPIHIWKKGEKAAIIDGHQRIRTLWQMAAEGYKIPEIPVVYVHAKDEKEARLKVLSGASQYGKVDRQGLYEFMEIGEIDVDELTQGFELPAVDSDLFIAEFYQETVAKAEPVQPEPLKSVGGEGDSPISEPAHGGTEPAPAVEPSTPSPSEPPATPPTPRGERVELTYDFLPEERQEIMAFSDDLMEKWKLDSHAAVIHHAVIQAHKKHCRKK